MDVYCRFCLRRTYGDRATHGGGVYECRSCHGLLNVDEMPDYCSDCRKIVRVHETCEGDAVCCECGLCMQHHMIDDRAEWRTFQSDAENGVEDKSRVGAPVDDVGALMRKHWPRLRELRSVLQSVSSLFQDVPDACINLAMRYLAIYVDKAVIRGDDKRQVIAAAALYFASRSVNVGAMSKDEVCYALGVAAPSFTKACNDLETVLLTDPEFRLPPVRNLRLEDNRVRMLDAVMHGCPGITQADRLKVWRRMNRFIQLVQASDDFASSVVSKLTAALIYVSCRSVGIMIPKRRVADLTGASEASILENETIVMKVLKRREEQLASGRK